MPIMRESRICRPFWVALVSKELRDEPMVIMATEGTKPATGAAHLLNKFKIHCERKSKLLPARHSKSALGLHGVKVQATKFR